MTPRQHKLGYFSSYDRGLQHLLEMWPLIKESKPHAELHIAYGWELFLKGYQDNPERLAWKDKMDKLMTQEGITHHGRLSKTKLKELQQECGIWAYPTDFGETNCITALDCQASGCVPCTMNYAGLKETVQSGIKLDGDIYEPSVKNDYLNALVDLMNDEKRWEEEQKKGIEFARNYSWDNVASKWAEELV